MLGGLQCPVHCGRCLGLHPREHMAVEVERDPDLAMPEAFARDLWVDAGGEQMCGMRVSEIWKRTRFKPRSAINRVKACVRLCGCSAVPSACVTTW